ncbi:ferric reductase transmembrane component 5 [Diutina catenulata]
MLLRLLVLAVSVSAIPYYWSEPQQTLFACNIQIQHTAKFCPDAPFKYNSWYCPCTNKVARATLAGCLDNTGSISDEYFEPLLALCRGEISKNDIFDSLEYFRQHGNHERDTKTPIVLDKDQSFAYRESMCMFLENFNKSTYYGAGMLGYWALIMLMGAIANWTRLLCPGLLKYFNGSMSVGIRRHITLPALRSSKTSSRSVGFIPSRYETIVIATFLLVVIILCAVNVTPPPNDPLFPNRHTGVLRYVAGRCAVSSGFLVPLLILFGGRNNLLLWLTRWNFATFVMYHRWIGRVVFGLASAHAIAFSYAMNSLGVEEYSPMMRRDYMVAGTVAVVATGAIVVQGALMLRRRHYEIFIGLHLLCAFAFIIGSWIHVAPFNHAQFYVVASAIWILDRGLRVIRMLRFGAPYASLTVVDDTIRVEIDSPNWQPNPGGFGFVYFFRPSCFWQSHPFTFNYVGDKIVFYVKIKGGTTHGLYRHLMTCRGQTDRIRVCVEGSYGEPSPAYKCDNAVYVAGGNGIPGPYYEARSLALSRPYSKQTITLIWVIRHYSSLRWFYKELQLLQRTKIRVVVFVTAPERQYHINRLKVEFLEGRPCMDTIVRSTKAATRGSIGFVACGHPKMVDDLRKACIDNLDTRSRIDFYEHLQVW